jgi:hypothetical protein
MNDSTEKPFEILGPKKIKLGREAREWAKEWGMTEIEMGKFLLEQHKKREGES